MRATSSARSRITALVLVFSFVGQGCRCAGSTEDGHSEAREVIQDAGLIGFYLGASLVLPNFVTLLMVTGPCGGALVTVPDWVATIIAAPCWPTAFAGAAAGVVIVSPYALGLALAEQDEPEQPIGHMGPAREDRESDRPSPSDCDRGR